MTPATSGIYPCFCVRKDHADSRDEGTVIFCDPDPVLIF